MLACALALPCLGPPAAAAGQLPLDLPGPHLAASRDVAFSDARFGRGWVTGRLYFPSDGAGAPDPSAGPFPLVGFQHGWLGSPDDYDELSLHLASWGFLVASIGTATGFFADPVAEAADTQALLWWTADRSATPGDPLEGMADPRRAWSAVGHSMGGGALAPLVGLEPRVGAVVGLQASGLAAHRPDVRAFPGAALWIAGSNDWVVRPDVVRRWFEDAAVSSRRDLYVRVRGLGHLGPTDDPGSGDPLPGALQHRIHRLLVTAFLRAEVLDEVGDWSVFLGPERDPDRIHLESACLEPPAWLWTEAGLLRLAAAGRPLGRLAFGASFVPAPRDTPFGELGFAPGTAFALPPLRLGLDGLAASAVPLPPSWRGRTLFFAALAAGDGRPPRFGPTGAAVLH